MKLKKQFDVLLTELNSEKQLGDDGIYGFTSGNETQKVEIDLRKSFALDSYSDYLETLRFHHSIPVMDREVDKFIDKLSELRKKYGFRIIFDEVFEIKFIRKNDLHYKTTQQRLKYFILYVLFLDNTICSDFLLFFYYNDLKY